MKVVLVSVYDSKAAVYNDCYPALNREVAKRQFIGAVKSVEALRDNKGDYSLVAVAEFDKATGLVEPIYPVETLLDGRSVEV